MGDHPSSLTGVSSIRGSDLYLKVKRPTREKVYKMVGGKKIFEHLSLSTFTYKPPK